MFKVTTEKELANAFRPRDRRTLVMPPKVTFPLYIRDYLAWPDPAGGRLFVLFEEPGTGHALGLAFRDDGEKGANGLCEWCHNVGNVPGVSLMMCEKNSKRAIGTWLCKDLACGNRVENMADLAGRNGQTARKQVLERMWKFAHEGLGIERVPTDQR